MEHNKNHTPIIYSKDNIGMFKSIPILNDGQIYIYVMLSDNGNVKIGKTTNIQQRVKSLSGSNGGGYKIIACYCSSTWMQSMEGTCHNHYHFARIPGTEWFDGNKVDFQEVVKYVDDLFHSDGYERCNEVRRKFIEQQNKNKK